MSKLARAYVTMGLAVLSGVLLAVTQAPWWAGLIPAGLLGSFGTALVMLA